MSIISDCLDDDICEVMEIEGEQQRLCPKKIGQASCPVKCRSYLPKDDPCYTQGTN